jgi:hypothetical protein
MFEGWLARITLRQAQGSAVQANPRQVALLLLQKATREDFRQRRSVRKLGSCGSGWGYFD